MFKTQILPDLSTYHLLLVEDNDTNQKMIHALLALTGARLAVATNGAEALAQVQQVHPDLILMDLHMPVMDGFQATQYLREQGYTQPIIALSAAATKQDRHRAHAVGMNAYLMKPIDSEHLYQALMTQLGSTQTTMPPTLPAASTPSLPIAVLPGFDLQAGHQRFAGQTGRYLHQLCHFRQQLLNDYPQLLVDIHNQDLSAARQRVHALKGQAGNLGAMVLYELADQLETQFDQPDSFDMTLVNTLVSQLEYSAEILEPLTLAAEALENMPQPVSCVSSSKESLLIVDDEPSNIATLKSVLEDRYQIRITNSGEKALALLDRLSVLPDLILLDVLMPGISGYAVCEHLKANSRTAEIPVIFVTARDAPRDEEKGLKLGAVDYITKPFIPGIVRARVQTQINLKQKTDVIETLNRNLSERVRQEVEKNREQERLLMHQSRFVQMGEMLSMIAHQWRQPLHSVSLAAINLTTAAELDALDAATVRQQASFIQALTQRMSDTIDDFTDFFKPDRHTEIFHLHDVFEQVTSIASAQLQAHLIQLQINMTPEARDCSLLGRKNELAHVFLNLLTNARDAFEDQGIQQGKINIQASLHLNWLQIQVSDNAGGIAPDVLDRLFDPYFTTKPKSKGTGIGLYMCRTIIERNYQGEISVKNHPEGAVFTLGLPLTLKSGANKNDE